MEERSDKLKNRKFGIFVSSTYNDLIDERNVASQAILESGHIPMGMELFTPNGRPSIEIIKKAIDNSDYVVLIIAGMYGTICEDDGIKKSFVEMEYDYARKSGIPVLLFFHKNIDDLPSKKVEKSENKRKKLSDFKKEFRQMLWERNGVESRNWKLR